jgi:signal transduction histidine kinase
MFNSLRLRLFLSYLLVVAVSVLVIGLALLLFLRTNTGLERLDVLRLTEFARSDVRNSPPPARGNLKALNNYARQLATAEVRVAFIDSADRVVVDSAVEQGTVGTGDISEVKPLLASGTERERGSLRDSSRTIWVYYITPASAGDYRLVLLTERSGPLQFLLENFLNPLLGASCVGIGLSVFMALLISFWLTNSLRKFSVAASAVAQGNLETSVPVSGPTEIKSLAQAFNDMLARVKIGQQSQRDFLANVSHELKTPLTSIQGFSQAILDNATEPIRAAQIINDEASRMRRLVDGLLDLARLDAGQAALQRGPTDLTPILHSVAEKLSLRATDKSVTLKVDIQTLPIIVADGDRLAQVFTNLLDNALKHTPGGGTVTLTARPDSPGGTVSVVVTDTGQGIPADDLSRIFERFYRVDKSRAAGQGYGIGLAITKEIVQAHSGSLKAESVVGLGTKFTVRLPVSLSGDATVSKKRK